jgi:hypothetical protein
MLAFFPTPYPDELLYSAFARYHVKSRSIGYKQTMNDLFGNSNLTVIIDLPKRLNTFYALLPEGSLLTPDCLIRDHTLLPLFKPFLSNGRVEEIIQSMKGNSSGHKGEIFSFSIKYPAYFRYCHDCYKSDIQNYGEAYWHRTHQIFGVEICPLHQSWLIESDIRFQYMDTGKFIDIGTIETDSRTTNEKKKYSQYYHKISEAVYWLLNNDIQILGIDNLKKIYLACLAKFGLMSCSGKIDQKKLADLFEVFFGEEFLKQLNCSFDKGNKSNWIRKLLLPSNNSAIHPIQHILFMLFLGITPEGFFSSHIDDRAPPINNNRESAVRLRLKSKKLSKTEEKNFLKKKNNYRTRWLDKMKIVVGLGRDKMYQIASTEYNWLLKNDSEWLKKHLPNPKRRSRFEGHIDWEARDSELEKQVITAKREIRSLQGKPVRITKNFIGKYIGKLPLIKSSLEKLPRTKKALEVVMESEEKYQITRLKWAINQLFNEDQLITCTKVRRLAGFDKILQSVAGWLEKELER